MNYLYNTLFGHSKQFLATLAVGKTMALVFLVAFSLILLQFQTAGAAIPFSAIDLYPFTSADHTNHLSVAAATVVSTQCELLDEVACFACFSLLCTFLSADPLFHFFSKFILKLFGIPIVDPKTEEYEQQELNAFVKKSINESDKRRGFGFRGEDLPECPRLLRPENQGLHGPAS